MINVGSRNGIFILKILWYDNFGVYFLIVVVNIYILMVWDGRFNGNNVFVEWFEYLIISLVDGVEYIYLLFDFWYIVLVKEEDILFWVMGKLRNIVIYSVWIIILVIILWEYRVRVNYKFFIN